jgi:hypothetical protein
MMKNYILINTVEEQEEEESEIIFDDVKQILKNNDKSDKYILFANCGRWNGTYKAVKMIDKLQDIFKVCGCYDDIKLYFENNTLKLDGMHHDATDYITIKALNKNISDRMYEQIENEIYLTTRQYQTLFSRYTKNIKISI